MKDDKSAFPAKNSIKEFCHEDRCIEEFIHSMQSHFVRNDLQKIIFMLELAKAGNRENLAEEIEKTYQLCKHSMRKLEILERIQELNNLNFSNPNEFSPLIAIIEEVGSFFDLSLMIDFDSINYMMQIDGFFKDLLYELFSFIKRSNGDRVKISGGKCDKNPDFYVLQLSESKNDPFSKEICEKLLKGLKPKEWDYSGDNIEITLASMIARYYGGKLTIHSSEEIGNCYSIFIPYSICKPNSINQNQIEINMSKNW